MKEVAALLGLTSVLESRVGGPLDRGISGTFDCSMCVQGFVRMLPGISRFDSHVQKAETV